MELTCSRCGHKASLMFEATTSNWEKWKICPSCIAEIISFHIDLKPSELKLEKYSFHRGDRDGE